MANSDEGSNAWQTVTLVVVLLVIVAAVILLQRTLNTAQAINDKASNIAETGRGINIATDSIIQLDRTNSLGESILATAQPLEGQLNEVVALGASIDQKASSINSSAVAINRTAKAINSSGASINNSANGIEGETSRIIPIAESIERGVRQINLNVDDTTALARLIKDDTGALVGQAREVANNAACIDQALLSPNNRCN
ncbi:hypothetical protein BH20ACT2_BH20ACT2_01330 [soil metagenome]